MKRLLLFCGMALLVLSTAAPAQPLAKPPQQTTALTVRVTNGTADGEFVAGDQVIVDIYHHGRPLHTLREQLDDEGNVVLQDVPAGGHLQALVQVRHQNTLFSSSAVQLTPGENVEAVVRVFDVTSDTTPLGAAMHHIIIAAQSETVRFSEFMQLENTSDMAVGSKGPDNPVISISLPEGFANLELHSHFRSEAIVTTEKGFYDTMAIAPGRYEAGFSYTLQADSEAIDITRTIALPTANLILFVEQAGLQVEGLNVPKSSLVNSEGATVNYYKLTDLKQGDMLSFRIAGFTARRDDSYVMWIVLIVVFASIAVVALARTLRQGSAPSKVPTGRRDES